MKKLDFTKGMVIIMRWKILIVEDDLMIQSELKTLLSANDYEVMTIQNFSDVIKTVKDAQPHLILLDIKLPEESGFSLCTKIRAFSDVPIIFVTSSNADMDELNSIMLGGDAFITKPYHTAILLAKIASLLKRAYPADGQEKLFCQGAILYPESGKIEYMGKQTDLTKTELKILCYLFRHAGTICSRADMVEYLWDNQLYVDDNALSVNINRIRDKLLSIGLDDLIKTKHRQGYLV